MSSAYFLTNYTKDKLHNHMWRTATWSKPSAIWFALFLSAPTEVAGTGVEVFSAFGYTRVQLNPADANYLAPSTGSNSSRYTLNSQVIQFPNCIGGDWANVVALGRFDASTAGNLEGWWLLQSPLYVRNGDGGPTFPVGTVIVDIL